MVQTVQMLAPVANTQYIVTSGTTYSSDANRIITATVGDVGDLVNLGCYVTPAVPVVTPVVSTGTNYISQGCVVKIASSTSADAFTLAAPSVVGQETAIVNMSTGVPTITSSGADILGSTGDVNTVLTGSKKGTITLKAIGSTQWQIFQRGTYLSSAGAIPAYSFASS